MSELRHPGAKRDCTICRGTGMLAVPEGETAKAVACECLGRCPYCRDTGFVATGEGFRAPRQRCYCDRVVKRWRQFDRIRIPARYSKASLGTFKPQDAPQTRVLGAVSTFIKEYPNNPQRGMVLYGEVGRGKTHLLIAVVRELVLQHGCTARLVEFSHLLSDLKSGFDRGNGVASLLDPLVAVDVLAIDELGKGRNTEFEKLVVDELVSRRYNAMKPILATSNFGPGMATHQIRENAALAAMKQRKAQSLIDRVGDRVYSRLRESADFIKVSGQDYREVMRVSGYR